MAERHIGPETLKNYVHTWAKGSQWLNRYLLILEDICIFLRVEEGSGGELINLVAGC